VPRADNGLELTQFSAKHIVPRPTGTLLLAAVQYVVLKLQHCCPTYWGQFSTVVVGTLGQHDHVQCITCRYTHCFYAVGLLIWL
jgi:hypothetical protein